MIVAVLHGQKHYNTRRRRLLFRPVLAEVTKQKVQMQDTGGQSEQY